MLLKAGGRRHSLEPLTVLKYVRSWIGFAQKRPNEAVTRNDPTTALGRGCVETQKLHQHLSQRIDRFPAFHGVEDFSSQEQSAPSQSGIQGLFYANFTA